MTFFAPADDERPWGSSGTVVPNYPLFGGFPEKI
jgi:hypothetical protein